MPECPDPAEIEGLIAGRLPPDRVDFLERHLDRCQSCRRYLEDASGIGTIRPDGPVPECRPPSDALRRVMNELRAAPPSATPPSAANAERLHRDAPPFLQPTDRPGFLGRLGAYDIRREIGRGGMGVVFEAFDPALKRTVAVKILSPLVATDDEARGRFLREAQAAAALEHEHIVTVHAVDQVHGMPFLVMQYVVGESLADRLDREGRLPFADVLRIGVQVARGLAAAHAKGLIHRDIKPGNILLEEQTGRAKIADFGLAKAVGGSALTLAGTVAGTPEYMSPEQAAGGLGGEVVDARSDLFSLGVVLYAMCSGASPFRAESPLLTLDRVRRDEPAPLNQIDPALPDWFCAVVRRLLMKDPADRISSAAELADILEGKREVPPPRRRTRRPWWVAAAVVALLGIATAAVVYANRDRPEKEQAGPSSPPPSDNKEQPGPKPEPKPAPRVGFVVAGRAETFATLPEAVAAAGDGDTIEVHGDRQFPTTPVRPGAKPLTIRAAPGSRPVLVADEPGKPQNGPLFDTYADLHLEGLEIHWVIRPPPKFGTAEALFLGQCAIVSNQGRLTLTRCRVKTGPSTCAVGGSGRELVAKDCHFLAREGEGGLGVLCRPEAAGQVIIEGCQFENPIAFMVYTTAEIPNPADATVRLVGNTFASPNAVRLLLAPDVKRQPLKVTASRNVFDSEHVVMLLGSLGKKPDPEEMKDFLRSFVTWSDDANLYRRGCKYLVTTLGPKYQTYSAGIDGPGDWAKLFKQPETRSVEGVIRYRERPKSSPMEPLRLEPVGDPSGNVPDRVGADPDNIGPQ
jgi:serine/threonine protein kinase